MLESSLEELAAEREVEAAVLRSLEDRGGWREEETREAVERSLMEREEEGREVERIEREEAAAMDKALAESLKGSEAEVGRDDTDTDEVIRRVIEMSLAER